jgi:integrase
MPIRKLKGSWWVDFRHRGVRYRKRSPLNTRGGAREYELTLRGRVAQGEPTDERRPGPIDPLFAEFAERWFETYVCTNNKLSERCSKQMILEKHLLPRFGTTRLSRIHVAEIEAYKAAKLASGLSPKTVNNHLAVLGRCLSVAVEWRVLPVRPMIRLLRASSGRTDFLSAAESAALLSDTAEPMWNVMVRAALRTGMRPGELAALRWEDVNLRQGIITIRSSVWHGHVVTPKNGRVRSVPIAPDLRAALAALPPAHALVFCQSDGSLLTDTMRKKPLRRICKRTGVRRITWYTLRHTFASRLAAEAIALHVVKELMGHASIATTMRYTHVAPSALSDAVATLERAEKRKGLKEFGQPAVNRDPDHALHASRPATAAA